MEKILIIDDSVHDINVLSNILQPAYRIMVAQNGEDGLRQAETLLPSLILLDIVMPGMDGFTVLNHLKEHHNTRGIPVIFLTGLSDEKNEEHGLRLGAVDYIRKPFNFSIVKARVKNHVDLFTYRRAIENLALLDGLTGTANRRSYDKHILLEWTQAQIEKTCLSILFLSIDNFRKYNDAYGHIKGDETLKRVADVVAGVLPQNTFLARYEGKEFVILLSGHSKEEGILIAERLRAEVESIAIPHLFSNSGKVVTISIGGSSIIPTAQDIPRDFVASAYKQLLSAKITGKNKVVWESGGQQPNFADQITDREKQVVRLLLSGCSRTGMAEELNISLATVKTHLNNIYNKLGVSKKEEALEKLRGSGFWSEHENF